MTKIVCIGDPHIKTDNIPEVNLFMERLFALIDERSPDYIVVLGDLLHTHERLHTTALNKAYEFIRGLRDRAPTYVLAGNHDMCLGKNNPVLMWNGTCKMSQNIVKGDILIGDDGSPRTVVSTMHGKEEMYLVKQLNGENYTVTKNHKLSLKCGFHKSMFWNNIKNAWMVKWIEKDTMKLKSKLFALRYRDEKCYSRYIQRSNEDAKKCAQDFLETIPEMEIIDISVKDYLKVPKNVRERLYGFCSGEILWESKKVALDPYIMGAWLGDGNKDGSGFASADIEIIDKWCEWAFENDAEIIHSAQYNFSVRRVDYKSNCRVSICDPYSSCYTCKACKRHKLVYKRAPALACANIAELQRLLAGDPEITEYLSTGASAEQLEAINDKEIIQKHLSVKQSLVRLPSTLKKYTNPLRSAVKKCGVYNNKHIPSDYIVNDSKTRLKLLAGFIDTDGHVSSDGRSITISQGGTNIYLIDELAFLCRSLGFKTTISKERKSSKNFSHKTIYISGDIEHIPTVLKRKRCNPIMNDGVDSRGRKCADKSRTAISVEPIGICDYYGWTVDKNNRFLLGDFTVTHNCNNQQYLTHNHWMNGMKEWDNVVIVDKVNILNTDCKFVFCPYVPNGRFIEALDTVGKWSDADCIFAHQEFHGCQMNAITSVDGDKWSESYPQVISGHIHSKQRLQSNIYYTGSAMQHAFGESTKNIIAVLTFQKGQPYDLEEVDLKLPRKRIVHTTVEDMDEYKPEETKDQVKITISGVYDQFKAFKKTKKYKELIKKGTKVVFKPKKIKSDKKGEHEPPPEVEQESDFRVILSTLINQVKDPYLFQVHEHVVNGKTISEDDIIFIN